MASLSHAPALPSRNEPMLLDLANPPPDSTVRVHPLAERVDDLLALAVFRARARVGRAPAGAAESGSVMLAGPSEQEVVGGQLRYRVVLDDACSAVERDTTSEPLW